jgi:LPS O-antigen subunit length determinant protein (WzzB/FepE family)
MRKEFDAEQMMRDTEVTTSDISDHMAKNSGLIAFYGHQETLWNQVVDGYKLKIEVESAEIELRIRAEESKVTAGIVEAKVVTDPEIQKLRKALTVAKQTAAAYKVAVSALEQKGIQMSNLGALMRAERGNQNLAGSGSSEGSIADRKAGALSKITGK